MCIRDSLHDDVLDVVALRGVTKDTAGHREQDHAVPQVQGCDVRVHGVARCLQPVVVGAPWSPPVASLVLFLSLIHI